LKKKYLPLLVVLTTLLHVFDVSAQQHFTDCATNTGENATVIFPETVDYPFISGGEIAIFTPSGLCAGVITWNDQVIPLLVSGDDIATTGEVDGFIAGDSLYARYFDGFAEWSVSLQYNVESPFYSADTYVAHGIYVIGQATLAPAGIALVEPNGGDSWVRDEIQTISWQSNGIGGLIQIYLFKAGAWVKTISTGTQNSGLFEWLVPNNTDQAKDYEVVVRSADDIVLKDSSADYFEIFGSAFKVSSPNGGERWYRNTTQRVSWGSMGADSLVQIYLFKAGEWYKTISTETANDGSYDWVVAGSVENGSDYQVVVRSLYDTAVKDTSDAFFRVTPMNGENAQVEGEGVKPALTAAKSSKDKVALPSHFALEQNYPNPFASSTSIRLLIPETADVRLVVYDVLGRAVQTLENQTLTAGIHTILVDAGNLASGIYNYRVSAGSFRATRQMTVVR